MNDAVNWKYKRGPLLLLPYTGKSGVYKEDTLIVLYNRIREEGLWSTVFHENTDMSLLEFMNFFSSPLNLLQVLSLVDGDKLLDIVGISWISDVAVCQGVLSRGVGSFLFFMDYQKPAYTDPFSEMILDYWFNTLEIDTIMGVTPEKNRAALVFVKRSGMREVGRLPHYTTFEKEVVTGVVTLLTRTEFNERQALSKE